MIETKYLGINASDVNFAAGKYLPGVKPPFTAGFEATGIVVAIGSKVQRIAVGTAVVVSHYGAFAEYLVVPARQVVVVRSPSPEYLTLLVSGVTASISLEKVGELKAKEVVLVTAAAGATGLFAVQLAKLAGAHVVATVGSDSKREYLKSLGVDRVINYKTENLNSVLKAEYPQGVDVVYESVGGDIFEICVNNLAQHGRLIIIGSISGYKDGSSWSAPSSSAAPPKKGLPLSNKLLVRSASLRGFFLNHYAPLVKPHVAKLVHLIDAGKLKAVVDESGEFVGLSSVCDALDHLYQGKNIGKVYVKMPTQRNAL
eukprot:TRINITY_DN2758_c0_g1_i1.p1 TRINITY_DN2758_c0_g1~~TRINITY_DN2758_c0_g1_i1.p1  ORF type:complete len:369 (-),score=77.59 TRINITY_DN2758_c0_g1_i1:118-1059(-)